MYRALSLGSLTFDPNMESPLEWIDEFARPGVGQTRRFALAGNLHVAENPRRGRPLSLLADPKYCWIKRETGLLLMAMAETAGQPLSLVLQRDDDPSIAKTVVFDRARGPFALEPVDPFGDYLSGTIYLIEV
ncbi:MAG TPA: hypothetical protein PKY50_06155 [Candidatus Competibacter sp.]|nr:hypothetical protein [Candidatus Competibacter sp.]